MKILIINGNSRLGNTWNLTMLVKKFITSISTEIHFEEIHLKDLNLPFCLGCSVCFRKGHSYCPHNNIIQGLMDKFEENDGIIFSAPTYNMQMPALTKNFIDHLCFALHRPRFFEKKALVISTTGGVGATNATKYMAGTMIGWGFNRCYQLPISAISWNDYKPTEKHMRKVKSVSETFYNDVASKKLHSPSFSALIPYNLFRGMSIDYRKGTEFEMRDGSFWEENERMNSAYSTKVPLPIFKGVLVICFLNLQKRFQRK